MNLNKHSLSRGESKQSFKMYKRKKQWVVAPLLFAVGIQLAAAPITSISILGAQRVAADNVVDTDITAFNAYKKAAIDEVNGITKLSAEAKKIAVDTIKALALTTSEDNGNIATKQASVDAAVLTAYKSVGASVSADFVKIYTDQVTALVTAGLTEAHGEDLATDLGDETDGTDSLAALVSVISDFASRAVAKSGLALALSKLENQITAITPYLDETIATYTELAKEDKYLADQVGLEAKKQAALALIDTFVKKGLGAIGAATARESIAGAQGESGIATALDTARETLATDLEAAAEAAEALALAKTKAKDGLSQLTNLSAEQVADYKVQIDAAKSTAEVAAIVAFDDATVNGGTAFTENSRLVALTSEKTTANEAVDDLGGLSTAQKTSFKAQITAAKNAAEIAVIKKKAIQADTLAKAAAANNLGKVDDLLKVFFGEGKTSAWTVTDDGLETPAADSDFAKAALAATTSAELVKVITDAYTAANTAADQLLIEGTGGAGVDAAGIETLIQTGGQANLDAAQGKINQLIDTAKKAELQAKLDAAQALLTAKTNAKAAINELAYTSPADKATAFTSVDKATTVEEIEAVVTAIQKADWLISDTPVKALILLDLENENFAAAKNKLENIKDPETKAALEKLIAAAERGLILDDVVNLPDAEAKAAIEWLLDNKVTTGYADTDNDGHTNFGVNDSLTRLQTVLFLYRLAGSPKAATTTAFPDLADQNDEAKKAVNWAKAAGITTGYGNGYFGPNDKVTREQFAAFLYREAGEPEVVADQVFADVPASNQFAKAITWLAANNIAKGYGNIFGAKDNVIRQHAALFLKRFSDVTKQSAE
ncbi:MULTISPECIES: S-layer homology domain-containing protein [unclassified Enterococcus]|uniref:S-layer homology domain-containing protein n=1 Tax=unclassified Enterococcus TaxID=2608891 RepID=UPI001555D7A2|nr:MULTISPECIES: S-layer homology domain-containing protein [unclassified Enterococcus]MBS7577852.1 GA module-containing protein [Enterococcus sp. MMGLQ5-2]MBS7585112.1 GA module-containing protein [Enterococcus sp. MMGLQ5-1]NPD12968.1 KxYKxGKxW signal peptide domain-containing protein [Enterococcus sp. MMGLQ5-1]NPD37682.1 KxYKxGKxW signal peptide domain-containing protein [Enterococcus sp. MMGLQ5-2]